jgi:hypothetical protein
MTTGSGSDRRRSRRRRMPFVRSAILEVAGRGSLVIVSDLSPEGAFLATRVAVEPTDNAVLKLVVPRDGRILSLPCQVTRHTKSFDPQSGLPAGMAVKFRGLDAAAVRRIEEFAMEGFLPSVDPTPQEHFEYRLLERFTLDESELNQLGLDGWRLVAALPSSKGVQLVLMRKL